MSSAPKGIGPVAFCKEIGNKTAGYHSGHLAPFAAAGAQFDPHLAIFDHRLEALQRGLGLLLLALRLGLAELLPQQEADRLALLQANQHV